MEFRQLIYFIAVAKTGNMHKAAEELHISQSTLSLSNKKLEEEFNVPLFQKQGRYLELTNAGRQFLLEAESIINQTEHLRTSMSYFSERAGNTLSVVYDAVDFASEAENAFMQEYPEYEIQFFREYGDCAKHLISDMADAAITLYDISNGDIVSELVMQEPMLLLVNRSHKFAHRRAISIQELSDEPVVITEEKSALSILIRSFFAQAGMVLNSAIIVTDPESLIVPVNKNRGVTFMPQWIAECAKHGDEGFSSCVTIPVEEQFCQRTIYVSYRKTASQKINAELLNQFIAFCHTKNFI